jgi:glutathione S-transferase
LAINPKGRVPALVTHADILTETPAILAYIAQRYPQANLAPLDDPFAFARMQAFNSYLCSTVHVAHAHWMCGTCRAPGQSKSRAI